MISPNFGEASFENQPPTFNEPEGKFVQDPNSSGLIVPESYARDKAAKLQAEQQTGLSTDAGVLPESMPYDPELVPEAAKTGEPVADTTPRRAEAIAKAIDKLGETGVLEATSEEDVVANIADATAEAGGNVEKEKARARRWLDRAAAVAGMSFNEFKAANEGSSLKTFLDAFLVFGTEGRFGDTSASSLRESLGKDTDDAYLNEVLEKGGEKTLVKFFKETLNEPNLQDLSDVKSLVVKFNLKAESSWDEVSSNMADFLNNEKGQYKERSFVKIKALFARLEGKSQEDILKYFNIDLNQEAEKPTAEATINSAPVENTPTTTSNPAEVLQPAA